MNEDRLNRLNYNKIQQILFSYLTIFYHFIQKNIIRVLLFLSTIFFTIHALLVSEISRTLHRHHPSEAVSVSLLFEFSKFIISAILLGIEKRANKENFSNFNFDFLEFSKYSIPALLYLLNENVLFVALSMMDAVTFELLSNLKILLTAIFLSGFLNKRLNNIQIPALLLLALGTAVSQWVTCDRKISSSTTTSGVMWTLVYATFSSAAGVYTEHLLKHNKKQSVHFQNMQLYAQGTFFSFLGLLTIFNSDLRAEGILGLANKNHLNTLLVINHVFTGLCISFLIKYADNIAKVYSQTLSMFVTLVLTSIIYWQLPSLQTIFGMAITIISVYLFYLPFPLISDKDIDVSLLIKEKDLKDHKNHLDI